MSIATIDHIAKHALSTRETVQASYNIARLAIERGIPGDFVECGVYAGAQCAAMALALWDEWSRTGSFPSRRVHLFDSFTGIPQAGPHDEEFLAAGHQAGLSACSLERVQENMRRWGIPDELLVYHPGLFEDTVPGVNLWPDLHACKKIAVLRLDGDLYESTKVCMQYLWPLVSPGGWIIIDDYHLTGCRKAVHDCGVNPGPIYFLKD